MQLKKNATHIKEKKRMQHDSSIECLTYYTTHITYVK